MKKYLLAETRIISKGGPRVQKNLCTLNPIRIFQFLNSMKLLVGPVRKCMNLTEKGLIDCFFINVLFLLSAQQLLAGLRPVTRYKST